MVFGISLPSLGLTKKLEDFAKIQKKQAQVEKAVASKVSRGAKKVFGFIPTIPEKILSFPSTQLEQARQLAEAERVQTEQARQLTIKAATETERLRTEQEEQELGTLYFQAQQDVLKQQAGIGFSGLFPEAKEFLFGGPSGPISVPSFTGSGLSGTPILAPPTPAAAQKAPSQVPTIILYGAAAVIGIMLLRGK